MPTHPRLSRRPLLALLGASAVAGCARAENGRLKVVVAGAGIIGAAIGYFLSKNGAKVTIIEKDAPAARATGKSFGWINASWAKQPRHYHSLSQLGVSGWAVLEEELGIPVVHGGSLEWFDGKARMAALTQQIEEQQTWGEPSRMVEQDTLASLVPSLAANGPSSAAFAERDAAVDPVAATRGLLSGAQKFGAEIIENCGLEDVALRGARLRSVITSQGELEADRLVLATGAALDLPATLAGSAVPQEVTPGVIVITNARPMVLRRLLAGPDIYLHQLSDGRIVLGEPARPLPGVLDRAQRFPDDARAEQEAARLLAKAAAILPDLKDAEIADVSIGWRPMPIDGHPVLGPAPLRPDIYLAITHSGVTLAPAIGQLAAYEIIEDRAISRLAPYRPGRAVTAA
ncbi:MAG: NAD(P)/FAD-dependent oxidoreductase [Sphingomonadales bacterium]